MELLTNGPPDSSHRLLLAHGAGAPMDSTFMETIARRLAKGGLFVARFEFDYMAKRRKDGKRRGPDRLPKLLARYHQVIDELGEPQHTIIGGKSMGGRIASMIADEVGAAGVVCLGYPFHPPGKPTRLRTSHLETLRTPTLILQGTRDRLGSREEVGSYSLSSAIRIVWLEDGDHSFKPRKKSGRTHEQSLAEAADAIIGFAAAIR
jgi:predicted alpha/beta-hydrolase family hydrolase